MSTAGGPLEHLKVLDLTRMYPGAFATLLLADLGADVVKVESPGTGDGIRPTARRRPLTRRAMSDTAASRDATTSSRGCVRHRIPRGRCRGGRRGYGGSGSR